MLKYALSAQGRAELKRSWTITILASFAAIIAVFSYNLLYRTGGTTNIIIFFAIAAALAVGFVFGRKKYFANTDGTQLTVDDDKITLHVPGQPEAAIAFENIRQIKEAKQGIHLISKLPAKRSVFVMDKFEGFDEIQKLIAERVREHSLMTVK
ncbi:hypothetical protein [Mucilaginibacter pedocola]|uniref:Uncharacterized protein n=1 Tax=Mucilaginibacter pedocola TaxID=1792845 RepID=A0A1S9PCG4_9SPHI|nr:hypothetical protein [Mucilaginibacter pedocola]OOQ58645.1 hypothetical protein BC343_08240 [Mucilaginibacter pedocola]